VVLGVLGVLVGLSYVPRLGQGFSNDDFTILDKVRGASLGSLVGAHNLLAGWWRPWSRELHFALLDRLAPGSSTAFHAANLVLWLGIVALAYVLLRRLAGPALAAPVLAGAVAASSWGLFVLWACASQDLWMLIFSLLFLLAFDAGRPWLASVALLGALLSKETAVVCVPLAAWLRFAGPGRTAPRLRDWAPVALASAAWLIVHPSLGGRWLHGGPTGIVPVPAQPHSWYELRWLLAPLNLEYPPHLASGMPARALEGLAWSLGLGGIAAWGLRAEPARAGEARRRLVVLGLGWWVIAWTPMLAPFLHWHSYYGWLGLPGLWLALAAALSGRSELLMVLVALAGYLRPFEANSLVNNWGTEQYQRVAAANLVRLRDGLRAQLPVLPPRSRVYLAKLPAGVGFHTGPRQSMPLRVWYRDSTVMGCVFSEYTPREAGDAGRDWFFVLTPDLRLLPVADGRQPVPDSLAREPLWALAEEQMARDFMLAGQNARALTALERLAATHPADPRFTFNLAEAYEEAGDHRRSEQWLDRADSLVGSPPRRGDGYREWENRGGR
jgi:hypothetical protein